MNSQQIINLVVGIFFIIIIIIVIGFIIYRSKTFTVANKLPGGFFRNLQNMSDVKNNRKVTVDFDAAYEKGRPSHDDDYDDYGGGRNKPKRKNPKRRRH